MPYGPKVEWTEEQDEELTRLLRLKFYSNSQIADLLSEKFPTRPFTRNSVIGRVHRLEQNGVVLQRKRDLAKSQRAPRVKRIKSTTTTVFETIKAMDEAEPLPNPIGALTPSGPILLDDLRKGMCRWPSGDAPPYLFCGRQILKGSFCAEHCRLGYTKPQQRQYNTRPSYRR